MSRGQGRIFLRGATYWAAFYVNGKEQRESCQTDDPRKAERYLRARLKEAHAHEVKPAEVPFLTAAMRKVTVADLMDALETHYELHGKNSLANLSNIKRVKRDLGHVHALSLTKEAISVYQRDLLASGLKKATCNRFLQCLHRGYTLAELPAPKVQLFSEKDNTRKGFTSRPVLDRVLAHLEYRQGSKYSPAEDLADVIRFAFLSSWRKSEILSLRWDSVTPDTIRLAAESSKEREARSLPLEGELAEIIERRRQKMSGPLVFHHGGEPFGDYRKAWAKACRLAGVPGLLIHDLRRSGVRDMIRAGVAPHTAMTISGHKTDSMLRRYAIIDERDQRQALRRTEEFRKAEIEAITPVSQVVQ